MSNVTNMNVVSVEHNGQAQTYPDTETFNNTHLPFLSDGDDGSGIVLVIGQPHTFRFQLWNDGSNTAIPVTLPSITSGNIPYLDPISMHVNFRLGSAQKVTLEMSWVLTDYVTINRTYLVKEVGTYTVNSSTDSTGGQIIVAPPWNSFVNANDAVEVLSNSTFSITPNDEDVHISHIQAEIHTVKTGGALSTNSPGGSGKVFIRDGKVSI